MPTTSAAITPASAPLVADGITKILRSLADYVGSAIEPADVIKAFSIVKDLEEVTEDLKENIRRKLLAEAMARGQQQTEKGTRRVTAGGYYVDAIPARTGYDPKKVEACVRAKNLEPTTYMDTKVTYVVNEEKLKAMPISDDERELLRYELTYRLMSPKKVNDNE